MLRKSMIFTVLTLLTTLCLLTCGFSAIAEGGETTVEVNGTAYTLTEIGLRNRLSAALKSHDAVGFKDEYRDNKNQLLTESTVRFTLADGSLTGDIITAYPLDGLAQTQTVVDGLFYGMRDDGTLIFSPCCPLGGDQDYLDVRYSCWYIDEDEVVDSYEIKDGVLVLKTHGPTTDAEGNPHTTHTTYFIDPETLLVQRMESEWRNADGELTERAALVMAYDEELALDRSYIDQIKAPGDDPFTINLVVDPGTEKETATAYVLPRKCLFGIYSTDNRYKSYTDAAGTAPLEIIDRTGDSFTIYAIP